MASLPEIIACELGTAVAAVPERASLWPVYLPAAAHAYSRRLLSSWLRRGLRPRFV
jgi:hypothetical protein